MVKFSALLLCLLSLSMPAQASQEATRVIPQSPGILRFDTGIANVYLLPGPQPVLIDSSTYAEAPKIENWLLSQGVQPKDLALIIVTHGHGDHAGGGAYFQKKYGTPIWVGHDDAEMLIQGKHRPATSTSLSSGVLRIFVEHPSLPFTPDRLIQKPVSLHALGHQAYIQPLPGHTQGSLAVILEDESFAVVGDLLRGDIFRPGVAEVHFLHENRLLTRWQIWRLLEHEKIRRFYPGHFAPMSASAVKQRFFPQGSFHWLHPKE